MRPLSVCRDVVVCIERQRAVHPGLGVSPEVILKFKEVKEFIALMTN